MRMWMVDPNFMCRQHLLGEHAELHKCLPAWKKQKPIAGSMLINSIEPTSYKTRHDELATEMLKRGSKHRSPIEQPDFSYLPLHHQNAEVVRYASWTLLFSRCPKCRERRTRIAGERFIEFREVSRMIAKRCCKKYSAPWEEALDHANFALAMLLLDYNGYDSREATLKHWLGLKIHYHLKDVYLRGKHPGVPEVKESKAFYKELVSSEVIENSQPETKPNWLHGILQEASEEAYAVYQIIIEAPQELLDEIGPQRNRRQTTKQKRLKEWLMDVLDWPKPKIETAFKEITTCLQ